MGSFTGLNCGNSSGSEACSANSSETMTSDLDRFMGEGGMSGFTWYRFSRSMLAMRSMRPLFHSPSVLILNITSLTIS